MTVSIPEHAKDNTLLIPESLYTMSDAHCVMAHGDAAVFYKNIGQSMVDIEFFTNAPCLAFVMSGQETFSSFDNDEIILRPGQMLLMPKHSFMVSDFIRTDGPLEAFLFFFNDDTIREFTKNRQWNAGRPTQDISPCKIASNAMVTGYMKALHTVYKDIKATPELVRIKLLELLNLLETLDRDGKLNLFLATSLGKAPKRNIRRLLSDPCHWRLSIADLAQLSGRPVTSFNRDFKRQFGTTPRKWLIGARLDRSLNLLERTSMSVSEIALEVGYDNYSHFISVFKKKFGISPKKMRLERNW